MGAAAFPPPSRHHGCAGISAGRDLGVRGGGGGGPRGSRGDWSVGERVPQRDDVGRQRVDFVPPAQRPPCMFAPFFPVLFLSAG
jgi:hypothetical protein